MADEESAAWREELSRYRQELERFLSHVRALQRSLGRALRAGDARSGLQFLEDAERAAALGVPTFPSAGEWRERLDSEWRRDGWFSTENDRVPERNALSRA